MSWSERWKEMSLFRKTLLVLMAAMVLGFGIATPIVTSVRGIAYEDGFLGMEETGENVWYSGRLDGENAEFIVYPSGTVEYRWGEYTYGPYQVVEAASASPEGQWSGLPGIEIRRGDEVLFRGGYVEGSWFMLVQEDGEPLDLVTIRAYTSTGEVIGENGRSISEEELHEPSLSSLAKLVLAPEVTNRGSVGLYFLVTLLAAFNMVQICFPDMMFRLSLWGHVRNVEAAEPSDFYVAMEHLEWMVLAVVCFALYWKSLFSIG